MIIVHRKHNTYRVDQSTGDVEVYIERGQPRVMQPSVRSAYWRRLKRDSETALKVRMRAFNAERRKERAIP